jgi:hypothetical protein
VSFIFGNPKLFNAILLILYITNAGWWAAQRKWADVSYWLSASAILATVTWGYKH